MKITRLERTVVCVPFIPGILPPPDYEEPTPGYPEPVDKRNQDIVRLHTDEGLTGIGMSGPYYGWHEDVPPDLVGRDPLSFEPRTLGGGGYDIALLDLIGKCIGWPLCRIFGGKLQDRVPVDYWISRMGPEDSAAAARRAAELGFHGIKMKCKIEDGNVADRVHAMHQAAPDLRIVVDPNERFHTLENSLELARQIEGLDVIFEDPFPKNDWAEYRHLKEETDILIAPHLQNPRQVIAAVENQAVDATNTVLVRIRDNGSGIDPENLSHIFEAFHSTKGHRGTGLGLAVAQKIIAEHNGNIEVESSPARGTAFTIYLPLSLQVGLAAQPDWSPPPSG